jgi:oligopeptide transport system substrate-binding protein
MNILLSLLLLFFSCQKPAAPHKESSRPLRIAMPYDLESLDPRCIITYPTVFAMKMAFEGLMRTGQDGKIENALAERVEISEDQMQYTFYLRQSAWSNGDAVTAYDFEYSWKTHLDPAKDTKGKHNLYVLKNAKAVALGKLPVETLGVKALDAKTLLVTLEHPAPYFLEIAATTALLPVNARVDQETPDWAGKGGDVFVSNGPFVLKSRRWNDELVFEKNPSYWDAEHVRLPAIKIGIVKEPMTVLHLFEKGELDWAGKPLASLPPDAVPALQNDPRFQQLPCAGVGWYFLNVHTPPFNNKKIRQAFAYAINREAITKYVLHEGETPALSVLPALLTTQKAPYFQDHNEALALQLFEEGLQELGLDKKSLPPIALNYSSIRATMARVAEAVQQQWQQLFGITVTLEQTDPKVHYSNMNSGKFQIGVLDWLSWLHDPIYFLQTFRFATADGVNFSKWEHPEYQRLLNASEEELDPAKRLQIFNQAEQILADEFPAIPIYNSTMTYLKDPSLHGVFVSKLYEIDFRWAYFTD